MRGRLGFLGLAAVLGLCGCGGEKTEEIRSVKVGVTLYDQYDTFISELMNEFTDYASKKEEESGVAVNLEILDASGSQLTQNEQVQTLIEKGCDVVCVNLVDRTELSVNRIVEEGIEVEKLGYAIANWNRAQAQTKTATMLAQFDGRIELIIANNDDMALGAIDALKAAGLPREEWPAVVGIDGTSVGMNAVKKGEMIGTVYNDKEGQAREMMNLAFALATGGDLSEIPLEGEKYVRMPYYKVAAGTVAGEAEPES